MTWQDALEAVVGRTRHERYRQLCGDDHPDRDLWRQRMIEQAMSLSPSYPSARSMASNVLVASARVVKAVVRGEPVMVAADVLEERRALCLPCEFNGHRESGGIRCTKCGCSGLKLHLATERCPVGKW
jgi:hypothetical protein